MDQTQARKIAKERGGIAVHARRSPTNGNWLIGGWLTKDSTWIVVSLDRAEILDDTSESIMAQSIVLAIEAGAFDDDQFANLDPVLRAEVEQIMNGGQ